MKKLMQIQLGNSSYNYIENENGTTNVDGYKFTLTDSFRKTLGNKGGFLRDFFKPSQNEQVEFVTVLFADSPIKGHTVGAYFEGKDFFDFNLTTSGRFIEVVKDMLDDEEVDYEVINSLEHSYKDERMIFILDEYNNPEIVDDTGLFIGDKMVDYGNLLITKNPEFANEVINELIEINDENKLFAGSEKVVAKVKPHNPFNLDVELVFFQNEHEPFNFIHQEFYKKHGKTPDSNEYENEINLIEVDLLHSYGLVANEKIDRNRELGNISHIERIINQSIASTEREISDMKDDYISIYIDYALLQKFLKQDLFIFSKN